VEYSLSMEDEEQLLVEHRKRIAERKARKVALQQKLVSDFLGDIESDQKQFLVNSLHSALILLKNKKATTSEWEKNWSIYENKWLAQGISKKGIERWFAIGIDEPEKVQHYLWLLGEINVQSDINDPPDLAAISKKLITEIKKSSTQNSVQILVELEESGILKFQEKLSHVIYGIHLGFETGSCEPGDLTGNTLFKWSVAENVLAGKEIFNRLPIKKLNDLDFEIIDYGIEKGIFGIRLLQRLRRSREYNYLLARTEPDSKYLTNNVIENLNWKEESLRRLFNLNVYKPEMENIAQLKNLNKLRKGFEFNLNTILEISENPNLELRDRIKALEIIEFVDSGELSENVEKDSDTWRILMHLAPENCFSKADPLSNMRFRRWCFVRMMQYFVLQNKRDEFMARVDDNLIRSLFDNKPLKIELYTGNALIHLRAEEREEAKDLLKKAKTLIENDITTHNLELVLSKNYDVNRLNPYLVAGIPHDVSQEVWRRQLNEMRARAAREGSDLEIHLNWAKGVNDPHVKTSPEVSKRIFRYPASPQLHSTDPPGTFLHPPARPIPRKYFLEKTIDGIRGEAFGAILPEVIKTIEDRM